MRRSPVFLFFSQKGLFGGCTHRYTAQHYNPDRPWHTNRLVFFSLRQELSRALEMDMKHGHKERREKGRREGIYGEKRREREKRVWEKSLLRLLFKPQANNREGSMVLQARYEKLMRELSPFPLTRYFEWYAC